MSLYKILEEVKPIQRFQLIQTAPKRLELRLISSARTDAFAQAKQELLSFLRGKSVEDVEITLSDQLPQADPISGKFKHISRAEKSAEKSSV